MSQLPLPLAWEDGAAADFIVSPANIRAVRHLEHPALWPVMATMLTGPRRSGRSLLARQMAARRNMTLIDDAERRPEEELFHAWNQAQQTRMPLVIVADDRPPGWTVMLPDLRSRLAATPAVSIGDPDDGLVAALIDRGFRRRGIAPPPGFGGWLARRLPRSYLAVERAVDLIDAAMLSGRRRLTTALAREAITPVIDLSQTED